MASNGSSKYIMWIIGVITVTVLPYIGNAVIENDKGSRSRDEKIDDKLTVICEKQNEMNQKILIALQDIQTEQRVTKELIKSEKLN